MSDIGILLNSPTTNSSTQAQPRRVRKVGRWCSVRECSIGKYCPSTIVMHGCLQHSDFTVKAWKTFCGINATASFPKQFYICSFHFTEDCHNPSGNLRRDSIPTIRIPFALQPAENQPSFDQPPSPLSVASIPSEPPADISAGLPSLFSPPPSEKSATEQWAEFQDLQSALAPYTIKTPSSKWVILNFPHAKPPKISFECLEGSVSFKSLTFTESLTVTILIEGNRYTKEETTVHQASELEALLAKIDAVEVLPCGCVEWGHVSDFERDLPRVKLPEDWFSSTLIQRQYQILFQRVDDHGRSIKTLSFSLNLLPRLHVRNERCLESDEEFEEAVKCPHDVGRLLEIVDKLKICSQTDYLPPAKADPWRKACQLVVLPNCQGKTGNRTICRTCHCASVSQKREEKRELKRKADRQELTGLGKQMRKIKHMNDKVLFGSTDAVEKLLNQMNDVDPAMDAEPDGERELLTL